MIQFEELSLKHKETFSKMVCDSGCYGADYSFANNYIWRHSFNPMVYFTESRMLLFMPNFNVYAYPKGEGNLEEAMTLLLDDAHERGLKLKLRGLTEKALKEFLPLYGDMFEISEDRNSADYIYTADKLCNLPGRHLSSKRNHINRFQKNGDWSFDKITGDNCDIAKSFVDMFYKEKQDPDLADEADAIEQMFENYASLGFVGGLLYQMGEPVAFTAGTLIDKTVFDVTFEKALADVEGAYTMVNREFARMCKNLFTTIEYFNREEDLGIEGLRKAKKSYHPDILLMKYRANEK